MNSEKKKMNSDLKFPPTGECENDWHVLTKGRDDMTNERQVWYVEPLYFTHLVQSFVVRLGCDISGS